MQINDTITRPAIDLDILRSFLAEDPYLRVEDVASEYSVSLAELEAIAKIEGVAFAIACDTSPFGTTPAPRAHGNGKLPPLNAVKLMVEREPELTAAAFAERYDVSLKAAYDVASRAGVRFATLKRGKIPAEWQLQVLGKRISDVFHFGNGVTVSYDDLGKIMSHFTGPTHQIWPRLQKVDRKGEFEVLEAHCDLKRLRPRKKADKPTGFDHRKSLHRLGQGAL